MKSFLVGAICIFFATVALAGEKVDVCVYGGTAGGVAAAVTVAKEGKSVILIEPGRHLGGMSSGERCVVRGLGPDAPFPTGCTVL